MRKSDNLELLGGVDPSARSLKRESGCDVAKSQLSIRWLLLEKHSKQSITVQDSISGKYGFL